MADQRETFTDVVEVDRIEFESNSRGEFVHVLEKGGQERRFDSKLERIIEVARQLDGAGRLLISWTSVTNKRRFTNRYIEDLALPSEAEPVEVPSDETVSSVGVVNAGRSSMGMPAVPHPVILTMRAASLSVELAKLDEDRRALVCQLIPCVLDVFQSSAGDASIGRLREVLGVPVAQQPLGPQDWSGPETVELADDSELPAHIVEELERGRSS